MIKRPEQIIEDSFVKFCRDAKIECFKLRIDGTNGFPDRTCFTVHGVYCFEFKTPAGVLSHQQLAMIARIRRSGGTVFVCTSSKDAIALLSDAMFNDAARKSQGDTHGKA